MLDKSEQLTAFCVSRLLEHLLEVDTLTSSGEHLMKKETRTDNPVDARCSSATPKGENVAGAVPLAGKERGEHTQLASTVKSDEVHGECADELPEDDTDKRSASNNLSPSRFPIIFVGFGIGAAALLSLGKGAVLPALARDDEYSCSGGIHAGGRKEDRPRHSKEESFGLSSALHRRGLHVGGFVLVNGFVSLEDRSRQARNLAVQHF